MQENKLTAKQEKFCIEYLVDLNATQAAIRAGYSEKTARFTATENLSKPNIQARISELKGTQQQKTEKTITDVVNEYEKIAFTSTSDIYKSWMTLKEFEEIPESVKAAISEIFTKETTSPDGHKEVVIRVKFHDKLKALERLEKYKDFGREIEDVDIKISFKK